MSIQRMSNSSFIPTCDLCGHELPATTTYVQAMKAKTHAGWKRRYNALDERWEDFCTDCAEDIEEARP